MRRRSATVIVSDNFNRPNNASTLGNAETGQPWVYLNGTWGVEDSKAFCNDGSAVINAGKADVEVSALIRFAMNEGIILRATDVSNCLFVRMNASNIGIFSNIAGTVTQLGSAVITPVVGTDYLIRVVCKGVNYTVFVNGIQVAVAAEGFNSTATMHGLRAANSGSGRFDNFLVISS